MNTFKVSSEKIEILPTQQKEAALLCEIQKRAFLPLYEKYHDRQNPCLRGAEDVLVRIESPRYRQYTIRYNGEIVGGLFYACFGRYSPTDELREGEYYLARVYIMPEYQNRGIATQAILLCEKEFPDAKCFFVDFPQDMDKNRRCYEKAGFTDTGKRHFVEGTLTLAVFEKRLFTDNLANNS